MEAGMRAASGIDNDINMAFSGMRRTAGRADASDRCGLL
jgi:hypothetical protein